MRYALAYFRMMVPISRISGTMLICVVFFFPTVPSKFCFNFLYSFLSFKSGFLSDFLLIKFQPSVRGHSCAGFQAPYFSHIDFVSPGATSPGLSFIFSLSSCLCCCALSFLSFRYAFLIPGQTSSNFNFPFPATF